MKFIHRFAVGDRVDLVETDGLCHRGTVIECIDDPHITARPDLYSTYRVLMDKKPESWPWNASDVTAAQERHLRRVSLLELIAEAAQ